MGTIFINDKLDASNYDNIKPKVPKTIFFEWNRNSFILNGRKSEVIEAIYSDIENVLSPYLDSFLDLRNLRKDNILPVDVMRHLIYLGYLTKWRVPISDDYVGKLNKNISFNDLNIFAKIESDFFSLDDLIVKDISPEIKRMIFSTRLFLNKQEYSKVFANTFIINFPRPLFITDKPFIELPGDNEFPSFIFPISSNSLLVYCDFIAKNDFVSFLSNSTQAEKYLDGLYGSVQISLMWHADNYIGCESEECLKYFLSTVSDASERLNKVNINPAFSAFSMLKSYKV